MKKTTNHLSDIKQVSDIFEKDEAVHTYAESVRLNALHQLTILQAPASKHLDRITRTAAQVFQLPYAAISLTAEHEQIFKSKYGFDVWSMPREGAPCSEVTLSKKSLVIEDLLDSPFYFRSSLARNGKRFYAGAPLITTDGHSLGSLCVLGDQPRMTTPGELEALTDLAAMVMAQMELQYAYGHIDPISGMPTRARFLEDLADLRQANPGTKYVLVFLDLARGEQISKIASAMGVHRVDEMIREIAAGFDMALGEQRTAYHVGATQFAFLSPADVEVSSYMNLVERTFRDLCAGGPLPFVTTVAFGARDFEVGMVEPEDLLRGAALAAHEARRTKTLTAVYCSDLDAAVQRRYRLLRDCGAALRGGNQFYLVFQPRVELSSGACLGAEALLRWRHPELGEIPPSEFIPMIEQTSLARPLTQWVLDEALDQAVRLRSAGILLKLSINISAMNLMEADLVDRVYGGLLARDLSAQCLEIELTESAMMEHPSSSLDVLKNLVAGGVTLSIDDFGTGHSSFAYLQNLPARVVKIDQSFIKNLMSRDDRCILLVDTIINLLKKLGYRVVAEGVEDQACFDILESLHCDEVQGYYYARPMPSQRFVDWLKEYNARRKF
ncbi:sensor domain-containing phosphodiesterase [Sphingomonas sp. 22176]|uniref:sensor domain-containing phosphodiesterase n=1 Tax=Sphingomonas sp. 22176 TaxID=3453884 RepID=UPI003F831D32